MEQRKPHSGIIRAAACFSAAFLVVIFPAPVAFGAGTPAGTAITNQAHATYQAGNGAQMPPISSNVVSVIVAQIGVVNISPVTAGRTTQINTNVDYSSTITNSGNGADQFQLSAVSSTGFATAMYLDANANGTLEPAEISAGVIAQTPSIAADSSVSVITRVSVPDSTTLNGTVDLLTVEATSVFDPTASAQGTYTTTIASAVLAFAKSVDNTVPRGGDRVQYTISYTNSGTADATGVTVTDVLSNFLNYVINSATPAPASVSGQTVTWNLGTMVSGASGSITFQVDLVNNVPPGTEIHNTAVAQYLDGPNTISTSSSETNFITVQSGGVVSVSFGPAGTDSGEPGDTVDYPLTVTNNGTLSESFTLSSSSSQTFTWTYFYDANGNGRVDSAEAPTTATGAIAGNGGQYPVVARTILGVVPADGTVDVTTFTVTSTTNAGNAASTTGTTTVFIPAMTMTKVADAPDPRPGREIRYEITYANGGGGRAYQFSVSDSIPANTAYIAQSVKHNGIAKSDEAGDDEVTVSNGVVTVDIGNVSPGGTGIIEFRVRIL